MSRPAVPGTVPLLAAAHDLSQQTALHYACRLGLSDADAEDCAARFVLHLLARDKTPPPDKALLRRCAHDFALDYQRILVTRSLHEVPVTVLVRDDGTSPERDVPDPRPTPEQALMRHVFWYLLGPSLDALPPESVRLLRGHYGDRLTARELAEELGRTEKAVEQALIRARRRLRTLLERAGIEASDLSACLLGGGGVE